MSKLELLFDALLEDVSRHAPGIRIPRRSNNRSPRFAMPCLAEREYEKDVIIRTETETHLHEIREKTLIEEFDSRRGIHSSTRDVGVGATRQPANPPRSPWSSDTTSLSRSQGTCRQEQPSVIRPAPGAEETGYFPSRTSSTRQPPRASPV